MPKGFDTNGLAAQIRAALKQVLLPEGGGLGDSPRLGTIIVDPSGKVSLSIQVTMQEAALFEPVRLEAQQIALGLDGVTSALVMLTAERETAPLPELKAPDMQVMPGVGAVVAVASGKGGVGKSTTTVGLALALRQLGLSVGILDADIYGPSIPTLLGLAGQPRMAADGRRLKPMGGWGISALSVGNLVDPDTAMIWRGPMITSAITQLVGEVDWGVLDILLIDMPPGTGDAQLAVAQNSPLKGAVIVSTPQDLALIDARRGITMFRKLEVPVLGVIENMSQFVCPDCGSSHAIFGHGGAQDEAGRIGVPFLGAVPLTMDLRRSADLGRPLVATEPDGAVGQAMAAIARNLVLAMEEKALLPHRGRLKGSI